MPYVIDPAVITFDATSSLGSTATVASLTWSHTVANQWGRMLVVGVTSERAASNACQATSVTYNAVALTKITQAVTAAPASYECASLWYLVAPATGAHNVVVTFPAAMDGATAGAVGLWNVKQGAPDAFASNFGLLAVSTSVTTIAANSWVVDVFGSGQALGDLAAGAGQTQRWAKDGTATTSGGMSTKAVAAPGSTTMTWTQTGINRSAAAVAAFQPGDTLPPANVLSLSSVAPASSAYISGTTVYYRGTGGGAGGSFQITNAVTDVAVRPGLLGVPGARRHYDRLDAHQPDGSPPPPAAPTSRPTPSAWTEGTSSSPTEAVTSTDNVGSTATTTLTFTNDSTAPTGSVTAPAGSANVRGNAVTVSSNSADTGGSGVASVQFQRSPAGAGTWTNIGAADTTSPYSVAWDTTLVADGLYDLRVVTTDDVGNTFTSPLVTNVRVDNTLPTNVLTLGSVSPAGAAYKSGTTVYYRGLAVGNFQLQNAVADAGSGPASSIFPVLGGTVGGWTHTTQTVSTPAGGPYVTTNNFAWPAAESASPTESVTSTDVAGNTSTATVLTFTNDSSRAGKRRVQRQRDRGQRCRHE